MNLLALFTEGEKVWVKIGSELETTTFKNAEIRKMKTDEILVLFEEEKTLMTYTLQEVKEHVFKKTALTNIFVKAFMENAPKHSEKQLSKEQLLQEIKDEMLSLQFCDSCQSNEGIEEELHIDGLEYLGSVYEFFGEVENYKLEGVFRLNGQFYVSYDAGNGHCHIGIMDEEMTEIMKEKFPLVEENIK